MAVAAPDVYVTTLSVEEIFADPIYQRDCDITRARRMASTWDRRLAGILEVSDRGEAAAPRYAVIDGQHRWAAAKCLATPPHLVANVHEGLTVADEAALFDKLNRLRKQTNTWDHWRARRIAGDSAVLDIEAIARRSGLHVEMSPNDGTIACVATLEKIVKLGGTDLLHQTLSLLTEVWGGRRDSLDAAIVHGLALILHYLYEALNLSRLGDAMLDTNARQLRANAHQLREISAGSGSVLTAIALIALYNKTPGRKILVSNRTFTGKRKGPA